MSIDDTVYGTFAGLGDVNAGGINTTGLIDPFSFSATDVPEPGSLSLVLTGLAGRYGCAGGGGDAASPHPIQREILYIEVAQPTGRRDMPVYRVPSRRLGPFGPFRALDRAAANGFYDIRGTAPTLMSTPSWPEAAPLVSEVKTRGNGEGFTMLERWLGDADILFLRRDRPEPLVVLPWRIWA